MIDFPDDRIHERMAELRLLGYERTGALRLVDLLMRGPSGPVAEAAFSEIIDRLDFGSLVNLLLDYFYSEFKNFPDPHAWVETDGSVLASKLVDRGFDVESSIAEGWVVTLQDGERLTRQYRGLGEVEASAGLPDRDEALMRMALIALGISQMRGHLRRPLTQSSGG